MPGAWCFGLTCTHVFLPRARQTHHCAFNLVKTNRSPGPPGRCQASSRTDKTPTTQAPGAARNVPPVLCSDSIRRPLAGLAVSRFSFLFPWYPSSASRDTTARPSRQSARHHPLLFYSRAQARVFLQSGNATCPRTGPLANQHRPISTERLLLPSDRLFISLAGG